MEHTNSPWPKRIGIGVLVAAAVTAGVVGVRMVDAGSDPDPAVAVEIREETRLASADDPVDDSGLPGLDDLDEIVGDLEACLADLMADLGSLDLDPTALPELPASCTLDDLQLPDLDDLDLGDLNLDDLNLDELLPDDIELPDLGDLDLDIDDLDLDDFDIDDLDLGELLPDDIELPDLGDLDLDDLELPALDDLGLPEGEFGDAMNELFDELLSGFDDLFGTDDGG